MKGSRFTRALALAVAVEIGVLRFTALRLRNDGFFYFKIVWSSENSKLVLRFSKPLYVKAFESWASCFWEVKSKSLTVHLSKPGSQTRKTLEVSFLFRSRL